MAVNSRSLHWLWMTPVLFVAILTSISPSIHAAPGTAHGPAKPDEASILWEDGQTASSEHRYGECTRNLQRLVDRHPGAPGYLRANLLLGLCYLNSDQFEKSTKPLKYFIEATGTTSDGVRARLALTRADIGLGRLNEALLLTTELLSKELSSADRLEVLVLKAEALLGLDEDLRASQALASFKKDAQGAGPLSPLTEEAAWVELHIKTRACARLPEKDSGSHLDEGTIRTQFKERGQCLQEALQMLKTSIQAFSATDWLEKSKIQMLDALESYHQWIENKLPSPAGKRKPDQKAAYERELRAALREDFSEFVIKTKGLLEEWKKSAPAAAEKYITPLMRALP